MDTQTLGAAIAIMKGYIPQAEAADVGQVLTVADDGTWTKGAITDATIAVNGTTLTITTGGE